MAESKYLTAPDPNQTGWPKGVKYIIGNEGCERFSFYGMRAILQVHLTGLFLTTGMLEKAAGDSAQHMYHLFVAATYALPMVGAIISDRLLGKYQTILSLSLVYCLGHAVLAVGENSIGGMWLGLALIAIGSGGIKPCVSAHVGDQFGKGNWNLVEKVFQAFYFIINFGSFFATLAIPWTRAAFGPSIAFGIPGILMFIATVFFWMGRKDFVHVPASPGGQTGLLDTLSGLLLFVGAIGLPLFFWGVLPNSICVILTVFTISLGLWIFYERQAISEDDGFLTVMLHSIEAAFKGKNKGGFFSAAAEKYGEDAAEGPRAVLRIISIFFLVSVFWALFDQHGSSWVRQAKMMNLFVGGLELLPSQIGALNPLMVMALIPFNNFFLYPLLEKRGIEMTPLKKMSIGMFVASLAFVTVAMIQFWVDVSHDFYLAEVAKKSVSEVIEAKVSVLWQILPYLLMTQAEVMVSITGLEFAYTQAPTKMKSTIMGFWLLSVSLGNKLTAVLTGFGDLGLTGFFWLFAGLMAAAAVLFTFRASFYKYRSYTQ